MARILRDIRTPEGVESQGFVRISEARPDAIKPEPVSHRERSELIRTHKRMKPIYRAMNREDFRDYARNQIIRSKWGGLSKPEPDSIHDPAPTPKFKFEKPKPRGESVNRNGPISNEQDGKPSDYYVDGHRTPHKPRPDLAGE